MRPIDLRHIGTDRVICCWEHEGVLVDPGPESCLPVLLEALGDVVPRAILLTHIHFDHAGAAGALVTRFPGLPVFVHARGARHLADPERLVASATRLYGEEGMRRLWGEVVPVPEAALTALEGGETVLDGAWRVAYTPGHASHHVCFLHEETGHAMTGDVAGVRIMPADLVIAPTPPPDVDVAAWEASAATLADWAPSALCLTHFGRVDDVPAQLAAVLEALHRQAEAVATQDREGFQAGIRTLVEDRADAATARAYLQATPPEHLWLGLDRWRRRQAGNGASGAMLGA